MSPLRRCPDQQWRQRQKQWETFSWSDSSHNLTNIFLSRNNHQYCWNRKQHHRKQEKVSKGPYNIFKWCHQCSLYHLWETTNVFIWIRRTTAINRLSFKDQSNLSSLNICWLWSVGSLHGQVCSGNCGTISARLVKCMEMESNAKYDTLTSPLPPFGVIQIHAKLSPIRLPSLRWTVYCAWCIVQASYRNGGSEPKTVKHRKFIFFLKRYLRKVQMQVTS